MEGADMEGVEVEVYENSSMYEIPTIIVEDYEDFVGMESSKLFLEASAKPEELEKDPAHAETTNHEVETTDHDDEIDDTGAEDSQLDNERNQGEGGEEETFRKSFSLDKVQTSPSRIYTGRTLILTKPVFRLCYKIDRICIWIQIWIFYPLVKHLP